ncbi:hypothetical protein SNA_18770 [Streptomyces natalensis ATCC 27448]|uniref:Uncharacterized protein n=1 Tax=Streptomyces natalensis ATCC 27448 TaxID=1240678 RepID=A0A0D7CLA6_9ACTN|nr:hypothetical protein SNA_18770 [Streptomyces natalensis ATCC 27448]
MFAVSGIAVALVFGLQYWKNKSNEETDHYRTGTQAKTARDSMPRWLPDDATDVTIKLKGTRLDRILKATLPSGKPPVGCKPLEAGTKAEKPTLDASWFPDKASARAQFRCPSDPYKGTYYAYMDGKTLYAWFPTALGARD